MIKHWNDRNNRFLCSRNSCRTTRFKTICFDSETVKDYIVSSIAYLTYSKSDNNCPLNQLMECLCWDSFHTLYIQDINNKIPLGSSYQRATDCLYTTGDWLPLHNGRLTAFTQRATDCLYTTGDWLPLHNGRLTAFTQRATDCLYTTGDWLPLHDGRLTAFTQRANDCLYTTGDWLPLHNGRLTAFSQRATDCLYTTGDWLPLHNGRLTAFTQRATDCLYTTGDWLPLQISKYLLYPVVCCHVQKDYRWFLESEWYKPHYRIDTISQRKIVNDLQGLIPALHYYNFYHHMLQSRSNLVQ